MEFKDVVQSEAQLRALMGDPVGPPVVEKTLTSLDRHCHTFIGRSPFVLIASSDNEGRMDISPKGDAPGFVKILDDKTLAIPDRPGNQRFDTFLNLFRSPRIGLIFLIPGKRETLRIGGNAQVVRDRELLESLAAKGKVPALAIVVHVDEAFFHCSKCMIRSHLWQPEQWPPLDGLPTLAETMKDAASFPGPVEALQGVISEDEETRLY
ncbi:MAG: pyridoxamine 5'-phosphate oxidase family protein [Gemmatimonadota bacterium]|nr:pyridoxamine 5'-phosphate oxidase family protein [Gemmatimonadota bacterium]MDH3424582.1 pyridoxamine 5'-phosphate oxidase family protein [Gemmatimonadota bacterium]